MPFRNTRTPPTSQLSFARTNLYFFKDFLWPPTLAPHTHLLLNCDSTGSSVVNMCAVSPTWLKKPDSIRHLAAKTQSYITTPVKLVCEKTRPHDKGKLSKLTTVQSMSI